jgi:hypothetical protein
VPSMPHLSLPRETIVSRRLGAADVAEPEAVPEGVVGADSQAASPPTNEATTKNRKLH